MSINYNLNKIQAFILEQTERKIRNLHPACLVLVLHTLTNDLKTKTPTTCIDEMDRICKTIHELYSNTKIILSLPTPRSDSQEYNNKGQLITAMIKDKFRANELITVCDNSNLTYKGEVIPRFIDEKDGFHLTNNAMLASNIRDSIDIALGLPRRSPRRQANSRRGRGHPQRGRGRGRGRGRFS